jgi:hypothetical protein
VRLLAPLNAAVVRGTVALWLAGFLVFQQFVPLPDNEASGELAAATRTLTIAVVAFYFGNRLRRRRTTQQASPPPETDPEELERLTEMMYIAAAAAAAARARQPSPEPEPEHP